MQVAGSVLYEALRIPWASTTDLECWGFATHPLLTFVSDGEKGCLHEIADSWPSGKSHQGIRKIKACPCIRWAGHGHYL